MSVLSKAFQNSILTLTLNRPEVHNALNAELIAALHAAFTDVASDVTAIVLQGQGKSFCAGADLSWMKQAAEFSHAENVADAQALSDMFYAVYACPVPVVANIHGAAYGGGVGLAACADIAVATNDAKFMLSEVRLGLTPATISPFVLRAMGARAAARYFVTAEGFDAQTAQRYSLVHSIDEDAQAIAAAITQNGPQAVKAAKSLVQDYAGRPIDDALRSDSAQRIADRRVSEEGQARITAFLERRK
jgi:methylglutaconyl-CoA hydratase